jgi:hypothetical protein
MRYRDILADNKYKSRSEEGYKKLRKISDQEKKKSSAARKYQDAIRQANTSIKSIKSAPIH